MSNWSKQVAEIFRRAIFALVVVAGAVTMTACANPVASSPGAGASASSSGSGSGSSGGSTGTGGSGGSTSGSGGTTPQTPPKEVTLAATDSTVSSAQVVVWDDHTGNGAWIETDALSADSGGWASNISAKPKGGVVFDGYAFDGSGMPAFVGQARKSIQSSPFQVSLPATAVSLRAGAVQGRALTLDDYAYSIAGTGGSPGTGDGTFQSGTKFNTPGGITTDGTYLYIADTFNDTIRKMNIQTGVVTTLAGVAGSTTSQDSTDGTGATAKFYHPNSITTDGTSLYVSDTKNQEIRKVDPTTGNTTTIVGSSAGLVSPLGLVKVGGYLYVCDSGNFDVVRVDLSNDSTSVFAGDKGNSGEVDAKGTNAQFEEPLGITTDGTKLYVTDGLANTIRSINIATQQVSTLAGDVSAQPPYYKDGTGTAAEFHEPQGITTDGTYLYVTDRYNDVIRKIDISTAVVTTIAGSAGQGGTAWGVGSNARFNNPVGITTDGLNLYVVDEKTDLIRKIQ